MGNYAHTDFNTTYDTNFSDNHHHTNNSVLDNNVDNGVYDDDTSNLCDLGDQNNYRTFCCPLTCKRMGYYPIREVYLTLFVDAVCCPALPAMVPKLTMP